MWGRCGVKDRKDCWPITAIVFIGYSIGVLVTILYVWFKSNGWM